MLYLLLYGIIDLTLSEIFLLMKISCSQAMQGIMNNWLYDWLQDQKSLFLMFVCLSNLSVWYCPAFSPLATCNTLHFSCRRSSIPSVTGMLYWIPREERVRKNSRPLTFAEIFLNDCRVTDYKIGLNAQWEGRESEWRSARSRPDELRKLGLSLLAFYSQISCGMSSHLPPWSWPSGRR